MTGIIPWLTERLAGGEPVAYADLIKEAQKKGWSQEQLAAARDKVPGLFSARQGFPARTFWSRPGTTVIPAPAPEPEPQVQEPRVTSALDVVKVKKAPKKPDDQVRRAFDYLKRRSPNFARALRELTERASADAHPCPTCGRGTPRSEEVRLRAILGALDKAGLTSKGAGEQTENVPLIVFPPGTSISLTVGPVQPAQTVSRPIDVPALSVTRADQVDR